MTKPVTMQKALRVLNGSAELSTADIFIQHVNARFATKASMLTHRCSPAMGHFYTVILDLVATPEECLLIEAAFKPRWKGVKVVYWQGRLSIHLDCVEDRDWVSFYDGKPLKSCLAPSTAPLRKAA
jgi:hypothetical protein